MIIYGSQMYGKSDRVSQWGFCDHCGKYAKQSSYNGRKFGHIYFIPLIPMGGKVRVLFECGKCNMGSHVPVEEIDGIIAGLRESLKPALRAAAAGQDTFTDEDGDTVNAGAQLAGAVAMLHACNVPDDIDRILGKLPEESQARHLVEAADNEVVGQVPEAIDCYKRACATNRDDVLPWIMLGELCANCGKTEQARDVYERALQMSPDNLNVVARLADVSEALKDWESVADHYEKLFEMHPPFTADRSLVKTYKKACKKSGRDPVALD